MMAVILWAIPHSRGERGCALLALRAFLRGGLSFFFAAVMRGALLLMINCSFFSFFYGIPPIAIGGMTEEVAGTAVVNGMRSRIGSGVTRAVVAIVRPFHQNARLPRRT